MNILMIGGHGMLGEPVARRLAADGHRVRLLARTPEAVRPRFGPEFEIVSGDVLDPASLDAALEGVDGVHINLAGGPSPEDYDRVERLGATNVAEAAARAGLKRLTMLTGTSVAPENAHFYATAAKLGAEEAVRGSGVPFTIFRASWFFESLPLFVNEGAVTVIGRHEHPLHWVAASDYAAMVSAAYASPQAAGQTFYVYGPEALTMGQALARFRAGLHPQAPLIDVSCDDLEAMAQQAESPKLADFAKLMRYYEGFREANDPAPADRLLGKPSVTLEGWMEARRAAV